MNASHVSRFILRSLPGSEPSIDTSVLDRIISIFNNIDAYAPTLFPNYPGLFLQQRKLVGKFPRAPYGGKAPSALHKAQPKSAARRSTPRGPSEFPYVLLKSDAPLKRSIFAWRRRPIPRVMQCPRQRL